MSLLLEAPKDWYPGTAISLGEMMRIFESNYLFRVTGVLDRMSNQLARRGEVRVSSELAAVIGEHLADLREALEPIDLGFTIMLLDRLDVGLSRPGELPTELAVAHKVSAIQERIEDELKLILVLQIPKERAAYFHEPQPFGLGVGQRFPSTVYDLEEAYKCFSVARYTAAVYHTMRALEVGLQELAADLQITVPIDKNWQTLLDACRGKIRRLPNSTPAEKEYIGRRQEALAHLQSVKDAWRNDTMHPRAQYAEHEALDILTNSKALLGNLAALLPASAP